MLRALALSLCIASELGTLATTGVHAQAMDKTIRLGIICGTRCEGTSYDALTDELKRLGWVEGRNLVVDRRGAGGEQQRLPVLAVELVASRPNIIVAVAPQPTRAAKDAAGSIPIVMVGVADPVGVGLVESLARRWDGLGLGR